MSVIRRTHGAASAWTTSQAIPYSVSATTDDECILIAANTVMPNDIAGWTTVDSDTANGYSVKVYRKDTRWASGATVPTVTATVGTGGVAWIEHYASNAGQLASLFFGEVVLDTTTGSTAFSAVSAGTPLSAAGDLLVGLYSFKSSATMTANATAQALTQAGATVGTLTGQFGARLSGASPTNSLYYACYTRPVTAGATGAITLSATGGTGAANVAGPSTVLLIRETSSNVAPTAAAGSDQVDIEPFTTVTLNGSGSTDSDGTIVTYTWAQTAGSPAVTLSGSGASRTFTAPGTLAGTTLTFGLTVTDDDGANSTQDTVDVTILPASYARRSSGNWLPAHIDKRDTGAWL